MRIEQTRNYDIFKKYEINRKVNQNKIEMLRQSIEINNMLEFYPITVNGNMEVMDGQHRLEACKLLNVPVFYTINKDMSDRDMLLINQNQNPWNKEDYLQYYCKKGYEQYLMIARLRDKYKFSVDSLLYFKKGSTGDGYNGVTAAFKNGTLKFQDEAQIEKSLACFDEIKNMLKNYVSGDKRFLNHGGFLKGLLTFLSIEELDIEHFKKKVQLCANKVRPCSTAGNYNLMWQDIYNYKLRIPFEF
jgi:hypothetical protein